MLLTSMTRATAPSDGRRRGRHRRAGRRRLLFAAATAAVIVVTVVLAMVLPGDGVATDSADSGSAGRGRTVIAWNPSHQDDTGTDGWHEYAVCGDIAKRTMALLPGFKNVLCWETGMGLTSSSSGALKAECEKANDANAQIFIAVHVNGGAQSGLSGTYYEGDALSAGYAEALLKSVAATMGMTFHYVRPRSNLFVLNPAKNDARIRVLLELGDNEADRELLGSEDGRQKLAAALAKAVKENAGLTPG